MQRSSTGSCVAIELGHDQRQQNRRVLGNRVVTVLLQNIFLFLKSHYVVDFIILIIPYNNTHAKS